MCALKSRSLTFLLGAVLALAGGTGVRADDTEIDVHLVESALECVVLGAGRCIEDPAALRVAFQSGR